MFVWQSASSVGSSWWVLAAGSNCNLSLFGWKELSGIYFQFAPAGVAPPTNLLPSSRSPWWREVRFIYIDWRCISPRSLVPPVPVWPTGCSSLVSARLCPIVSLQTGPDWTSLQVQDIALSNRTQSWTWRVPLCSLLCWLSWSPTWPQVSGASSTSAALSVRAGGRERRGQVSTAGWWAAWWSSSCCNSTSGGWWWWWRWWWRISTTVATWTQPTWRLSWPFSSTGSVDQLSSSLINLSLYCQSMFLIAVLVSFFCWCCPCRN